MKREAGRRVGPPVLVRKGKCVRMLYDLAVSAIVVIIAVTPMAFAAWHDRREASRAER